MEKLILSPEHAAICRSHVLSKLHNLVLSRGPARYAISGSGAEGNQLSADFIKEHYIRQRVNKKKNTGSF